MKPLNTVFAGQGTTIFTVMSALAAEQSAINLGQGFPDDEGPEDIRRAAAEAVMAGPNQYPPMMGLPELREAVADHAQRFYRLDLDWQTQVLVTSGATEALADSLLGLLSPGDEAILLEPFFDCYLPIVQAAGATAVPVALDPPDWSLPRERLAAAFNERTKLIVLNSPMNPNGKVFSREELEFVAGLLTEHDAYAVCDEVYEHLVFDGAPHVPLISLPGMAERCVRIQSAGKIFSLTGWKIGFVTAAPELLACIAKAHQFVTFTTAPPLQKAVAWGLGKDDAFFNGQAAELEGKRDRLAAGLKGAGFDVLPCEGTYFLTADTRPLGTNLPDDEFCKLITREAKVAAVPVSAFYAPSEADVPRHLVRFCFCKQDAVLDDAAERLAAYFV